MGTGSAAGRHSHAGGHISGQKADENEMSTPAPIPVAVELEAALDQVRSANEAIEHLERTIRSDLNAVRHRLLDLTLTLQVISRKMEDERKELSRHTDKHS